MKRQLGTLIGGAIAGVFVFNIWGILAGTESLGDAGGWLGGLLIVGFIWTVNHYVGIIKNGDGNVAIDMATAIAVAGTMNGVFRGQPISAALPTLLFVAIGGILGGFFAAKVQEAMAEEK